MIFQPQESLVLVSKIDRLEEEMIGFIVHKKEISYSLGISQLALNLKTLVLIVINLWPVCLLLNVKHRILN